MMCGRDETSSLPTGQQWNRWCFVSVQWEWLSLPIVVEIATAILLTITMWQSRRSRGVELWKSSNVALLYHYVLASGCVLRSGVKDPEELMAM